MPSKTSSSEYDGACDAFMEALDGFVCGLISLERLRLTITTLLDGNFEPAEDMQETLDATLREGYLDKSDYIILSTIIDLAISEDEPTESPRREPDPPDNSCLQIAAVTPEAGDAEPSDEMMPGMTLRNRFTLLEQIGSGSMGKIFKAVDRRKEESGSATPWIAIKSITETLSHPPNAPVALHKETANAQRLSHPNIIRVYDFDRDGKHVFMTMELLDGTTLTELLNAHRFRPLPAEQARSIIEGVCHGLIYAHELGIVHADVKPGNVFLTHDGHTKLLDFGISLAVNDLSQKSDVYAHTPSYASYEVLEGAEPTAQDDVYSLACVAYRILAGRRAYDGATAHDAEAENLELKPVENISPNEWAALRHAMALRRADRTTDVLSFLNEFSGEASIGPLPGIQQTGETRRAAAFIKFPRIASLCATLLVVIAATAALWPGQQTEDQKAAEALIDAAPALGNKPKPADIGPPIELRTRELTEPEIPVVVATSVQKPRGKVAAEPARRKPKTNPMLELSRKAEASLNQRLLLQPSDNSARLYISKMQAIDPEAGEFIQARQRFADLMMLEVMVAIADEDFDAADQLIAETKSLGVKSESTERYEIALSNAREAKRVRETDPLGSIFASTTPAAIFAKTDYQDNQIIEPLSAPMLGLEMASSPPMEQGSDPDVLTGAPEEVAEIGGIQPVDPMQETLPLSAFEFKRRVQPKYPRQAADRELSGWVELRFLINAQGKTEDIQVTDSEPRGDFEDAATKAVTKWRFKPATVDGIPVEKYSGVRLRFDP
jgi:TonB family protein